MNLVLPPPLLLLVSFDISGTALPRHVLEALHDSKLQRLFSSSDDADEDDGNWKVWRRSAIRSCSTSLSKERWTAQESAGLDLGTFGSTSISLRS